LLWQNKPQQFFTIKLGKKLPGGESMSERIKAALNGIIEKFENGDIPEAIAYTTFPMANVPSEKWSFLNRLLMVCAGTLDARGFRQWEKVKRQIKGGRKAFYIITPIRVRKEKQKNDEETILRGFKPSPVFRVEDTGGQALEYENMKLPNIPLMDKAREWGINIKAIPGNYN
jgi:hypothetical protein